MDVGKPPTSIDVEGKLKPLPKLFNPTQKEVPGLSRCGGRGAGGIGPGGIGGAVFAWDCIANTTDPHEDDWYIIKGKLWHEQYKQGLRAIEAARREMLYRHATSGSTYLNLMEYNDSIQFGIWNPKTTKELWEAYTNGDLRDMPTLP